MNRPTSLRIAQLAVRPPVLLAPMAGYTDAAMRSLSRRFGCGMTYTEVANAGGLVHGSRPTLHLLETLAGDAPAVAHLYGADPDILAQAALRVEATGRFELIDLNCGCPVRKIVAKGAGAALMAKPDRIAAIVRAIRSAVSLPVTVKTRLGRNPECMSIDEVADACQTAGAAALAVHARFESARHGGRPLWAELARVKARCRIPVIGNGGIVTARDALDKLDATGVDAVMVGRGAVGNPWIFAEIAALLAGDSPSPHTIEEHRDVTCEHLAMHVELVKQAQGTRRRNALSVDQAAARKFRGHLVRYLSGLDGWTDVRRNLEAIHSTAQVVEAIDYVLTAERKAGRTHVSRSLSA